MAYLRVEDLASRWGVGLGELERANRNWGWISRPDQTYFPDTDKAIKGAVQAGDASKFRHILSDLAKTATAGPVMYATGDEVDLYFANQKVQDYAAELWNEVVAGKEPNSHTLSPPQPFEIKDRSPEATAPSTAGAFAGREYETMRLRRTQVAPTAPATSPTTQAPMFGNQAPITPPPPLPAYVPVAPLPPIPPVAPAPVARAEEGAARQPVQQGKILGIPTGVFLAGTGVLGLIAAAWILKPESGSKRRRRDDDEEE